MAGDYDFTTGLLTVGFIVGMAVCLVSWLLWHFILSHIHIVWR